MSDHPLLKVENLNTSFNTEAGTVRALDNVGFSLEKGKILGIVGESGCGKSVTALSIMRLLPKPAGRIDSGRILYKGTDLLQLPPERMHTIRGKGISMIFQEPMTALNPVHRIGKQLKEVYRLHFPEMTGNGDEAICIENLKQVGIPEPEMRMREYPHQISGGMRQRVMIAMALAGKPDILIADEPTTALDVTIQAQILDLVLELQEQTQMAVMFITHDMGVIAQLCDAVVVMYAGKVVEKAPVDPLFKTPLHPYTKGLLASIPTLDQKRKTLLTTIRGTVPALHELPPGCRFQNRCPDVMAVCMEKTPPLRAVDKGHDVLCHLYA